MTRLVALALVVLSVLGGCNRSSSDAGDASTSGVAPFEEVALETSVGRFCALEADDGDERAQGLMGREDLAGYDGMLFVFDADTTGRFYMRNTPLALSIAFFTADGEWLAALDMEPCGNREDCPTYGPDAPYRLALEVPRGDLPRLGLDRAGSTLQVGGRCPAKRPT